MGTSITHIISMFSVYEPSMKSQAIRCLSKSILGPILDLRASRRCSCVDVSLHQRWFRLWWWRGFPSLFAPVCDGEAPLTLVVQVDPGQEVCGDVLGFDPWAGAHFCFPSLIEGHVPLTTSPVVPVDYWGVSVVAVLLETFPELTVICEPFLQKRGNDELTGYGFALFKCSSSVQIIQWDYL